MNHRTPLKIGLALLLAGTGTAFAAPNTFVTNALNAGAAEILLVQQAGDKFKQADMQTYVGVMVKDHTIFNEQLTELAKKHDIDVPVPPTRVIPSPAVAGKSPEASFAIGQVKVTQHLLDLYTAEANSNDDPDLKAFATAQLKDVQRHEKMATRLQKTYKK
ncbi:MULTISPECIES: DUF4142 domain-containing protein [Pseudomonas]|uniref:DUF4142 domain-containing protein n=1 Tax=Pseudomonas eucalypticola TaxID=2599595 RepID=A0A7D5H4P8_9PSED|nr:MULTISPECIES: DUF4142 domain-containing protein [Pseudomonas]QKZ03929.1 DUF4142 domain-containing protein [Pseudomonas eucalypticola]